MAEYIERGEMIKAIKEYGKGAICAGRKFLDPVDDIVAINHLIDGAQAVDAVPVVRCKDCKYAISQGSFGPGTVLCCENDTIYPLSGFCSKGTKGGGEGNDD